MTVPQNAGGLPSSLVHARNSKYPYRFNTGMLSSLEHAVYFEDFNSLVTTNVPAGWAAAIIDTGATLTAYTAGNDNGGVIRITSDGASEGVAIYRAKSVALSGKKFYM